MLQVIEGKKNQFFKKCISRWCEMWSVKGKSQFWFCAHTKSASTMGFNPGIYICQLNFLLSDWTTTRFFCLFLQMALFLSFFSEKIVLLKGSTEPLVVFFLQIQVILEKVQFFQQIGWNKQTRQEHCIYKETIWTIISK